MKIKTFVISLNDSPRRKNIISNFSKWPTEINIHDAFDGRSLSPYFLNEIADLEKTDIKYNRRISASEVGCAVSHKNLYEKLVNDDCDYYFIFEDDARPNDYCYELTINFISNNSCDLLSFFSGNATVIARPYFEINKYNFYKVLYRMDHTVGYLIAKNFAKELLNDIKKIDSLADWPIFFPKHHVFLIDTNSVDHINVNSSLSLDRVGGGDGIIKLGFKYIMTAISKRKFIGFEYFIKAHLFPVIIKKFKLRKFKVIKHLDIFG